ncbi:MAG TPA: ATP synthase F1 subunit delta [Prolixibacteraceae bacterium]|nr:ATP synthase F1 subunit delta [Prolixibacteraceae bacterium]
MNHSKINVRYAKALFSTGKEKGQIMTLHKDISGIYSLCSTSEEFNSLLDNPVISNARKKQIFLEIFKDKVSELTLHFVLLITENNREMELAGICRDFIDMVRNDQGILPATVTTAEPLSLSTLESIRKSLETETGKSIELTEKVNPEIIGGLILRIEDQQYDGSIATQLEKIRAAMLSK